jgi:hypothetical protein
LSKEPEVIKTEALTELQQPFDASQPSTSACSIPISSKNQSLIQIKVESKSSTNATTTSKSSNSHIFVRSDEVKLEGLDGVKLEPLATISDQIFMPHSKNTTHDPPSESAKGCPGNTLALLYKINGSPMTSITTVKVEAEQVKVEPLSTNQKFQPAIVLFKIENPNNTADEIEPQQVEKGLEGQTLNVIFKINDETIQQPSFSSLTSSIKQVESIKVEATSSHVSAVRRSRLGLFWRKHLVSRHQSRQRAPKRIIQSKRAKAKQRLIQYKEAIKSCSQSQVEAVEISPPHVAETSLPIKR